MFVEEATSGQEESGLRLRIRRLVGWRCGLAGSADAPPVIAVGQGLADGERYIQTSE